MKGTESKIWLRPALQGVTHWVGHRKAMYPFYPLPEAAFVAEICNLVQSNLPPGYRLRCEVLYRDFHPTIKKSKHLGMKARIDLVVETDGDGPTYLVEVKRLKAGTRKIEDDLERLACTKRNNKAIRAGLIVVSESARPKKFVNENGVARRKKLYTEKTASPYKVKGVVKAASSFKGTETAHYACYIEVL